MNSSDARGYRLTGRSIRIHAADYEVADFLGGFGVVAGHEGPVETWTHEIEHAASRRKADGLYLVDVPHDQAISLTLRLEAVPKKVGLPDWAVWLFVLLLLLVLFLIWWFLRKKR